jgi:DUF4097 and DUF4098 domain-containing protein YvlB
MAVPFRLLAVLPLVAGCLVSPAGLTAQQRTHRTADDWLANCRDNHDRRDDHDGPRACELRELGFRPMGRPVTLETGPNGAIVVTGWDRDSVHVRAVVQAQAHTDRDASDLLREVSVDVATNRVSADGPHTGRGESWSVSVEVFVPLRTDLTAETVNGPVAVEDVAGRLDLSTTNGPLTLSGLGGSVRARTTNGPVTVSLTGARWDGAGLDAETSNGPVRLSIPANYSARLETGTVNGPMSIDFPIVMQGRISMRRITTDLGQGGVPIRVVTTNGPVVVRRQ